MVAMALKPDESKLAVMYHQPYPNAADDDGSGNSNATLSRLILRIFLANGKHESTISLNKGTYYYLYFGKYANNHDLLYTSNGDILYNMKFRYHSNFAPRMFMMRDTIADAKEINAYMLMDSTD